MHALRSDTLRIFDLPGSFGSFLLVSAPLAVARYCRVGLQEQAAKKDIQSDFEAAPCNPVECIGFLRAGVNSGGPGQEALRHPTAGISGIRNTLLKSP